MAYQKKYYFPFVPMGLTESHVVEIWQDTATVLTAEEITAGVPPFVVEMPDLDNKFQTVRGTGCIMNLLSDTDSKFFDGLYHVDPKEFQVLHYIDGVLEWCGFLNSEMISEPYDVSVNYIVSVSGNDGFSLMDRFFFNETDASKYKGLKSEWEILQICLDKIGLPYADIRISLATTFTGYVGGNNSILHETFIDSSNFYDEDDKPMTLREVIESILTPYGAFIKQSKGSLYISDIDTMAGGGNVTYKKYNASTYAYIEDVIEDNEKDVTEIEYLGTGQQREMSGGTNRQSVTYSPYPIKSVTDELIVSPDEFDTVPETFSTKDGYFYRTLEDHFYYEETSDSTFEESYYPSDSDEHFIYYRHPVVDYFSAAAMLTRSEVATNINLLSSELIVRQIGRRNVRRYYDGVAILIEGKALAKTIDNPYDVYKLTDYLNKADKVDGVSIKYELSVGSYFYDKDTNTFVDSPTRNYLDIGFEGEIISNKWVDFAAKLNVGYDAAEIIMNGDIILKFYTDTRTSISGEEIEENAEPLQEIWVRNLRVGLANLDGSEISDIDIEYIGELNKTFAQEGEEVTLTTGSYSGFSDRGMKCWNDGTNYKAIEEWTRKGQTFNIEELLLNSLSSNYRAGYITLMNMNLKNNFNPINVITDTTFLGTKKLMQKSFKKDYHSNTVNADFVEISEDELTIVKD